MEEITPAWAVEHYLWHYQRTHFDDEIYLDKDEAMNRVEKLNERDVKGEYIYTAKEFIIKKKL